MIPVDIMKTKLPKILHDISTLSEILKKFKDMCICKGITSIGLYFVSGNIFLKACVHAGWRHIDCKMLSVNSERCTSCKKYSNTLSQKVRRMKKGIKIKRVSAFSNPFDQMKLKAMRKKLSKIKSSLFKKRIHLITNSIANQQEKVTNMTDCVLEKMSRN